MSKKAYNSSVSLIRVDMKTKIGLEEMAEASKRDLTGFIRTKWDEMVEEWYKRKTLPKGK